MILRDLFCRIYSICSRSNHWVKDLKIKILVRLIMSTDTGRVKWFNNKVGYGFITITDGQRSGTDVFVHHTAIVVENQQYKYLVQGEYVEFSLVQGLTHEYNATNVKGVKNCGLMCETKRNYSTTFTVWN